MKNIVVLIILIGLLVFFSSCKKQKMPEGLYIFTFENTEGLKMTPLSFTRTVYESTRKYIILGQDTLYKDGKNITGTIIYNGHIPEAGHMYCFTPFHITGIYDKSNGIYFINGTFESQIITRNPNDPLTDTTVNTAGTFEFKQFIIE